MKKFSLGIMYSSFSPYSVEFLSTPSVHNTLLTTEDRHSTLNSSTSDEHNSSQDSSFNTGVPSPSSSGGEEIVSPPQKKITGRHVVGSDGVMYKKPTQSYISIISTAILTKPDKKILLHEIYEFFEEKFPYFKYVESQAWKNSIRHNLSLNECFIKNGRSDNGKGNFWSVHPACISDFSRGDFRRRQARQRAKRGSFHQTATEPLSQQHETHSGSPVEPHLYGSPSMSGYTPMKSVTTHLGRSSRQYHPYRQQSHLQMQQQSCAYPTQYSSLIEATAMPSTFSLPATTSYPAASYNTLQNSYPSSSTATASCLYASSQSTQDKLPPPNINAAHLAQLGLSGSVTNPRDYFGVPGVRGLIKGYL